MTFLMMRQMRATRFLADYQRFIMSCEAMIILTHLSLRQSSVGEKNAGAIRSALPVYKQAEVNGGSVNLCSVDDAGIHNKLGNREFIFLDLNVAQDVTLTLIKTSGDDRRDPDFNIWRGTELLHKSATSRAGEVAG